ncbi:MAG: glycosyltransferase family 2 protein [Bacilli bacterium]|nr:glycosyltransferase family 2 protein [Bacilli bacterium]
MNVVCVVLANITLIFSLYFVITGLWAFKNKKINSNTYRKNKFAILIPCRNEEEVIGNLIDSLKTVNYPKNKYDIIVLPNNCTDRTRDVALSKEVKVIEVTTNVQTKGEVLRYAFSRLADSKNDAYIIMDADNLVHKDFLKAMNNAYNSGYMVAQGFRDAKNPNDNWLTGSYTLFYYLQNFFFNKSRLVLNSSAAINGTGFMIAKQVIDEYGFPTTTLTEDSEFTGICALNNIQVGFVSDAIVYDEHPTKFKDSWRQRKRWSSGSISCFFVYSRKLWQAFKKNHNLSAVDMPLFYAAPIIQVVSFVLSLVTFGIDIFINKKIDFLNSWGLFLFIYLLTILISMFVVKVYHKKIRDYYKGILFLPLFILTWMPINFICLIKKTKTWEPIRHTRNIQIEKIHN